MAKKVGQPVWSHWHVLGMTKFHVLTGETLCLVRCPLMENRNPFTHLAGSENRAAEDSLWLTSFPRSDVTNSRFQ